MASDPDSPVHVTVLRETVRDALPLGQNAGRGAIVVDLTLGLGGHTEAILEASDVTVLGVDRDPAALERARARLAHFGDRLETHEATFASLTQVLAGRQAVGIVADLGVSSLQLDDPTRGMSFRAAGPLDMRMGRDTDETAWDLVRRLRDDALANVIFQYGEERASRPIARAIKRAIDADRMETTADLAEAVYTVLGRPRVHKGRGIDPATRTFQALRIAVNDELGQIERMLAQVEANLAPGGVLAVIAFHSLEDRIVKHFLRSAAGLQTLTKRPLVPSEAECAANPRARSAKLRLARRRSDDEGLGLGFDADDAGEDGADEGDGAEEEAL